MGKVRLGLKKEGKKGYFIFFGGGYNLSTALFCKFVGVCGVWSGEG